MSIDVSSLKQVLETIAVRASTPPERQAWSSSIEAERSEAYPSARVHRLSTLLEEGDEGALQAFLALYQLDESQLAHFLATPSSQMLIHRPDWIDTNLHSERQDSQPPRQARRLRRVLGAELASAAEEILSWNATWYEVLERIVTEFACQTSEQKEAFSLDPVFVPEAPVPFEEFFLPFIQYAREQYRQQTALLPNTLVSGQVQTLMERWLLDMLSQLAAKTLQREFSLFRRPYVIWGIFPEQRAIYQAFLAQYQEEGLLTLFQEYSVLARLLVLLVEQWIEACSEFVEHLATDQDEIACLFHQSQPLGPLVNFHIGDSDPHHHGRCVFLLEFAAGLKLVYKPKPLDVDQAFFHLLAWCNEHGLSPSLKTLRVLSRGNYGWMEYVEQGSCSSQQEVENYYVRAGMLLCMLYVLGGTDMHASNLVACGQYPVFIDLETAISPGYPFQKWGQVDSAFSAQATVPDWTRHSVLMTLYLPEMKGDVDHACDITGLGGVEGHTHTHPRLHWKDINTDAMVQESREEFKALSFNTVLLQGTPVTPFASVEQVVIGFSNLHRFLVKHRSELLAPLGPLAAFENCPLRFVRFGTTTYGKARNMLKQPILLREGTDPWIELQVFMREGLTRDADQSLLKVAEAEVDALQRLDIPWFGTRAESHDLYTDDGEVVANVFAVSALERTRACLARLDEADLARQIDLIRTSFLVARPTAVTVQEVFPPLAEELQNQQIFPPHELVTVAQQIAQELRARAFLERREDGAWMGLRYQEDLKCFSITPVGFNLYDGVCGIALFLAALDSITGQNKFRDDVLSVLEPLCYDLAASVSSTSALAKQSWMGGGATGLGSFIYAFSHIGRWLAVPELHEAARHAAHLLTPELIQADRIFDIIGGNAGTILGLLTLYGVSGEQHLVEQAMQCADFLLTQRVATEGGARTWPAFEKQPLTGFSHGAAGIAYALLRLWAITGKESYKQAAEEAMAFEQQVFIPEAGNWPDLREHVHQQKEGVSCGAGWCHGAPGIGLARLGGLAILDTPQGRHDLAIALTTTQTFGLTTLDNLCCGNFGCIELLVAASQRLQQPQYRQMALQWTSALIHRARARGGFHLLDKLPRQAYNPGLFQGNAGVGYELLRVAFPERVPSLLLWEDARE